ncbi:hypothetical protein [uncultured Pseudokineococcus sp.]|uniref:hypothetical protein n=1 Tax=uncultured Pseudokineococcus sp. TaxID=1642928 RepID=UPI00262DFAF9|nr:hypothetical protein [uncultured Pseudokineococcus sp.]
MTRPRPPRDEDPDEGGHDPRGGRGSEDGRGGDAGTSGGGAGRGRPAGDAPGEDAPGRGDHPSEEAVDALLDVDLHEVRDRGGRGGDGPPPEALTAAHVLACERCQAVLADMRGVRGLLRRQGSGTPPPPDDLAARITAAVASDAARERRAVRARRRRSALALAASVALVGGLGTALALEVREAQTGGADIASGGGAAGGGAGRGAGAAAGDPLVVASGTDYALGSLGDQLRAVLDDPASAGASSGAGVGPGGPSDGPDRSAGAEPDAAPAEPRDGGTPAAAEAAGAAPTAPSGLALPADLDPCLTALGRPDAEVVAVDTARWEGRPADVLVLHESAPDPGSASGLAVWVVRLGCRGGQDALLHYEVVER